MVAVKRILVPTDFSQTSAKALAYGQALAGLFGGSLHVLHVIDAHPFAGTPPGEGYVAELQDFATQLEALSRDALARLVRRAESGAGPACEALRWGRPHAEIVRYAKEHDVDLIVMGTHGRGFVAHLLMGSVAERVVRTAPCPVLTVREREHDFVVPEAELRAVASVSPTSSQGGRA